MDTIVAQATAMVAQPIGIVRISGPKSLAIIQKLAKQETFNPRTVYFSKLYDGDEVIDQGVVIYFKGPHSFTGEDVVEIQVHGSVYVLSELISLSISFGARMAEPGEFSKRAFLNGKMSLDQAEAVSDLIAANSSQAAKSAVASLEGGLKHEVEELQKMLMDLRVLVEAEIDFSEEDIPSITEEQIQARLNEITVCVDKLMVMCERGVQLQQGIKIALIGEPNAGKSTLMNRICQKDVSIVTQEAGTTRDVIAKDVHYKGVCFHFLDTAGIRETDSIAEKAGIDRSYLAIEEADLVLYVQDATRDKHKPIETDTLVWEVENKADLLTKPSTSRFSISAKENKGVDLLLDAILEHFKLSEQSETPFSARKRHVEVLKRVREGLPSESLSLEIMAATLQQLQEVLSEITGEVTVDDMLGKLFSDFCIGK